MKKEQKVGIAVAGFALLAIIGFATGGEKATPTGNTSPIASISAPASPVVSHSVTAKSAPASAAAVTKVKAKPRRTTAPATPAPATSEAGSTATPGDERACCRARHAIGLLPADQRGELL
jgi:hypothetical protein